MSAAPPDLGALYLRHRDAMHKVAASVLRQVGRATDAADAVNDAMIDHGVSTAGRAELGSLPRHGSKAEGA